MSTDGRPEITVLGLPRMGRDRELKFALEAYWRGEIGQEDLESVAWAVRHDGLVRAAAVGLDVAPCGDQTHYDHVLDMALTLGALPPRCADLDLAGIDLEFALARGTAATAPLEMTKWFDTNYHHLVPEIGRTMQFRLDASRHLAHLRQATALGIAARPVLVGPYTFLRLSRGAEPGVDPLDHLDALVPLYLDLIAQLHAAGASGVQIDEPALGLEPDERERAAAREALSTIAATGVPITLATYFTGIASELPWVLSIPFHRVHIDLVRAPGQLDAALDCDLRAGGLSLGIVDGRNVWRTDPDRALSQARRAVERLGADRVTLATSCSLMHVPHSAARETGIDPEVHDWLAFADEKLGELVMLREAVHDPDHPGDALLQARRSLERRRASAFTNNPEVAARIARTQTAPAPRRAPFAERRRLQDRSLALPELPTTTIGSFPQTQELRDARGRHRAGELTADAYRAVLTDSIRDTIARQEALGLDVLVHGEPERNDMVEHFGERLDGVTFTRSGWVQSYGSRCVKPPLIYGDVSRPEPMTVDWWRLAQSFTDRPVKGMLTGPITILKWSFVRDDVADAVVAEQIALAVGDEVRDLEAAGCRVIQVDEPGLREGLPLKRSARAYYLGWAVAAFRLATAIAQDTTQIHTHMCYADFEDIVDEIARMDADVISLEASRSHMDPLDAFGRRYPNAVGPGVYDIHSPRIPTAREMEDLLAEAERRIDRDRLWVNPDCGLKTRTWDQVEPALANMVTAARRRRAVTVTSAD